jgi:hypothetical protein
MSAEGIIFRVHAVERMFKRGISAADVRQTREAGEVIEDYSPDKPYPSRLVLGWRGARPLHVVAALNAAAHETIVITVYEPDPVQWEADFKRRQP